MCWFNKEGIANIFSIPQLEEMELRIKYDSMDRQYIVQTKDGEFKFKKYEMGLPYIDALKNPGRGLCANSLGNFWMFHQEKNHHG